MKGRTCYMVYVYLSFFISLKAMMYNSFWGLKLLIPFICFFVLSSGGPKGFSDVVWSVYSYKGDSHITFTYDSYDGEEGI